MAEPQQLHVITRDTEVKFSVSVSLKFSLPVQDLKPSRLSEGHPHQPTSLNNRAVDIYDPYGKQASIADLEEAIALDQAVLGFVIWVTLIALRLSKTLQLT